MNSASSLALLIEENSDLHVKITKGVGGGTSNIHPAMVKGDLYFFAISLLTAKL